MDVLTRYMSLPFAIEFVTKRQMYLASFTSWEDKHEGYDILSWIIPQANQNIAEYKRLQEERHFKFGSSWSMNDESLSDWDCFGGTNAAAIQIEKDPAILAFGSISRNKHIGVSHGFPTWYHGEEIQTGDLVSRYRADEVEYLDLGPDLADDDSFYELINSEGNLKTGFLKHTDFAHEKEFRFVIQQQLAPPHGLPLIPCCYFRWGLPDDMNIKFICNPRWTPEFTSLIHTALSSNGIDVQFSKYQEHFH